MNRERRRARRRRGHLRGGLFVVGAFLALAGVMAGCGPAISSQSVEAGPAPPTERLPDPLRVYNDLDFVVGDRGFAAVGRFVPMPGPGDSVYALFALSLPNAALRFRRDPPGFLARYSVSITVADSTRPSSPVASIDETQEVRVSTFRETSRTDESVVFQGLLALRPGDYQATVDVEDLASSKGFTQQVQLHVPPFDPGSLTQPIVVHRVEPRTSADSAPSLIVSPRATVELNGPAPTIYLEAYPASGSPMLVLEVLQDGHLLTSDTLAYSADSLRSLESASHRLDMAALPPGSLELRARWGDRMTVTRSPLLIALMPEWLLADYDEVLSFLRYAGSPSELDSLRNAPPRERARRLRAFWNERDPNAETPENEFLETYFRRIQEANNRFSENTRQGWLTDRGAVYVTLGSPDEVFRHLDVQPGRGRSQVWLYGESLGFDLRLVFVDDTGLGAFRMTEESRRAFRDAVRRIYS